MKKTPRSKPAPPVIVPQTPRLPPAPKRKLTTKEEEFLKLCDPFISISVKQASESLGLTFEEVERMGAFLEKRRLIKCLPFRFILRLEE